MLPRSIFCGRAALPGRERFCEPLRALAFVIVAHKRLLFWPILLGSLLFVLIGPTGFTIHAANAKDESVLLYTITRDYEPLAWMHGGDRFSPDAAVFVHDQQGQHRIAPAFAESADAEVSFDGQRVLFAGKLHANDPWQIWEVALAGGRSTSRHLRIRRLRSPLLLARRSRSLCAKKLPDALSSRSQIWQAENRLPLHTARRALSRPTSSVTVESCSKLDIRSELTPRRKSIPSTPTAAASSPIAAIMAEPATRAGRAVPETSSSHRRRAYPDSLQPGLKKFIYQLPPGNMQETLPRLPMAPGFCLGDQTRTQHFQLMRWSPGVSELQTMEAHAGVSIRAADCAGSARCSQPASFRIA